MKRVRLQPKLPAALIQEQQRAVRPHHDDILAAIVVKVGEQRTGCVLEDAEARRLRDVLERSVAAIAKQPVGKARGLADVQIVEPIAIDVGDRDSVVAVDIDAARAIENSPPIIRSADQLRRIRRIAAESLLSDVGEDRLGSAAPCFIQRLPTAQPEFACRQRIPLEIPISDPLLAVKVAARAHEFIAHARSWPSAGLCRR